MSERKDRTSDILVSSTALLGFCLLVLTSVTALHVKTETLIDEFCGAAIGLFMVSTVLSFVAMGGGKHKWRLESIAAVAFLVGLFTLFVPTMVIAFDVVR
jgi:hypothetical protein